ncbi:MAG: BrnT family toxin [Treponema sp.]|nr:BrnT family toxin [Treponema sp.]MCL2251580.1 BrnT family toxin [Treponema sp.]
MELKFEWDENKATVNIKKHGVSFESASKVFNDPMRYEIFDQTHSFFENRWLTIGTADTIVLEVVFTERLDCIRIISAQKADKEEEEEYFYGYSTICN